MTKKTLWLVIILAVLTGVLGWWAWRYLYPSYQMWRIGEGYKKFERGFTAMLKNDTYGGQTPEETYNLYVDALKRGDTETASKYFYWERQVAQKTKLDELSTKGELNKYLADLPKWSEMREEEYDVEGTKQYSLIKYKDKESMVRVSDGKGGFIEATSPPGNYVAFSIIFEFNKQANIWKIYSL